MVTLYRNFISTSDEVRATIDRDKNEGGLIEFVKKGFICERFTNLQSTDNEVIYSEFTISNRKWVCVSVYRPQNFFEELNPLVKQVNLLKTLF